MAKSEKILNQALDVMHENDLTQMIRMIEQKLDDEDCTALELAAAFLKQQMGSEIKEMVLDEPMERRRKPHTKKEENRKKDFVKTGKHGFGKIQKRFHETPKSVSRKKKKK